MSSFVTKGTAALLIAAAVGAFWLTLASAARAETRMGSPETIDPRVEAGRRIYMEGLLPSGQRMSGLVAGDVRLTSEQVVCASCHRRSGLGSMEGQEAVPAVTGDLLYQPLRLPTVKPPLPPTLRPAYDDVLLKRAIVAGIRSDGRPLNAPMPRYSLSDDELHSVIAYLKSLKSNSAPGVSDREIHFASIVGSAVDPAQRKAFADVLETFVAQKNRETRHETQRAAHAPWHEAWTMKPYRKWVLHLWELNGPPESWARQLQSHYEREPVFAVVSGLAAGSWRPIHEFCESYRLPCIFPVTDLPIVAESDFYSIYFTRGMDLEADVVAQHLEASGLLSRPVVQVYAADDPRAQAAARRLRDRLARSGGHVADIPADASAAPGDDLWRAVLEAAGVGTAVLWLGRDEASGLWSRWQTEDGGPARVYLSTSLYGSHAQTLPVERRRNVYLVHRTELPDRLPQLLARSSGWLRANKIQAPDAVELQAGVFFALKAAGEAVKSIRGFFNRDFFIERIEHVTENAIYTSVYPHVSLAPRQRFVSRGAYLAQFRPDESGSLVAVTDWLIPGWE